ncbi:MAG: TSUP family transporter [Clostridia bacterium]
MILLLILLGFFGGILGGMGMGGGTFLIPLLTTFASFSQKEAAFCNLIVFIPLAIVSLFIHKKNGLIESKGIWLVIVISLVFAVGASFLGKIIEGNVLKICFGLFLVGIAVVQFCQAVKSK